MKHPYTSFVGAASSFALLLLASGCGTMAVAPLVTGNADSYTQHDQKNGLHVAVRPMTDKREIKDLFHINLLDNGLLPILVVAQNQNPSSSFVIAKDKVHVLNASTGITNASQAKAVSSTAAGTAVETAGLVLAVAGSVTALPMVVAGLKMASDATVIQYNLSDKEFYTHTLAPGEKTQGFIYFQFPKTNPPAGDFHIIAQVKDSAGTETNTFDFPVNLTLNQ